MVVAADTGAVAKDEALRRLRTAAALCAIGDAHDGAAVDAACAALMAGYDDPQPRIRAGEARSLTVSELNDLLPAALAEVGLSCYPAGSDAAAVAPSRPWPQ